MIKDIQLYVNTTKNDACLVANQLASILLCNGYNITDKNPDLIIGLGGDGTLLNLIFQNGYDTSYKYVGINCGTLGFLQDFETKNLEEFVKNIPTYLEQKLHFITIEIKHEGKKLIFNALNEFYLSSDTNKVLRCEVKIDNIHFENYFGTGIIFSTPTGCTARAMSAGGSILYSGLEAIQMTPSEPNLNSKMYSFPRSIFICPTQKFTLKSISEEKIKILSDNNEIYCDYYTSIDIYYSKSFLCKLTNPNYSYLDKLREKFI